MGDTPRQRQLPPISKPQTQFAKVLRKRATPSEKLLWRQLRMKQFAGWKFRRQQPVGPYIVDFYCSEAPLAVELDGESHVGRERADAAREQYLREQGIAVLTFWDSDVFGNLAGILQQIYTHCKGERADPSPQPPPARGGGAGERRSAKGAS